MKFSRQECWSGLPFPSPGDLPDPGTEPESPALQADSLLSESPGKSLNTLDEFKIYEFIMMLKKQNRCIKSPASLVAQMIKNLPAMQETQV